MNDKEIPISFYISFFVFPLLFQVPYFCYFAYVTCSKPHDCFTELNRIPHLRYSIFQFNKAELKNIEREKVGKEAYDFLDKLID